MDINVVSDKRGHGAWLWSVFIILMLERCSVMRVLVYLAHIGRWPGVCQKKIIVVDDLVEKGDGCDGANHGLTSSRLNDGGRRIRYSRLSDRGRVPEVYPALMRPRKRRHGEVTTLLMCGRCF